MRRIRSCLIIAVAWCLSTVVNAIEECSLSNYQTQTQYEGQVSKIIGFIDDQILALVNKDNIVTLWDITKKEELKSPFVKLTDDSNETLKNIALGNFNDQALILASRSFKWQADIELGHDGHPIPVSSIAFIHNDLIASASLDNTISLWKVSTRELVDQLKGHDNSVYSMAFSPDGKTLASGSRDNTIILWNVSTQKDGLTPKLERVGQLKGHDNSVYSVAFSPDGKTLASGGRDKTIRLWNVSEQKQQGQPLKGHSDFVNSVAFSSDGQILASGSGDKTVRLWNISTKPILLGKELAGHSDTVYSVAFSPDGKILASGGRDKTIRLWNVSDQTLIDEKTGHSDTVYSLAFSPDGQLLASGSRDNSIRLWDVSTLKLQDQFSTETVYSVAFSPDGKALAAASRDGTIKVLSVVGSSKGSSNKLWKVDVLPQPLIYSPNSVAFSPDGKTLASGDKDNIIGLWDVSTQRPVGKPLTGHSSFISSVAFSPDSKTLASASYDNTIRLWDVSTQKPVGQPLKGHSTYANSLAFNPDGKTLASGGKDNTIRLWNVSTQKPVGQSLTGHDNEVTSVAFSPDGKTLASGSRDKTIILWDVSTQKPVGQPLIGHSASVNSLAFSPDGKTLASGSLDKIVRLWDVSTRQSWGKSLTGHDNSVTSVAFSLDGQTLASGSMDKIVRLWDVSTQKLVDQLKGHDNSVYSVIFIPDDSHQLLASVGFDSTVRLWNLSKRISETLFEKKLTLDKNYDDLSKMINGFEHVLNMALSPNNQILALNHPDKTVELWDINTKKSLGKFLNIDIEPIHLKDSASFVSMAFSFDSKILALGSRNNTIRLWDISKQKPLDFIVPDYNNDSMAFNPDGKILASASSSSMDNTVRLWDVSTQKSVAQLTGHDKPVMSIAFSPNGQTLASGSIDETVRLWDVSTQKSVAQLTGHDSPVTSVAFSPDGQTLALGSKNNTVKLWDISTQQPLDTPLTKYVYYNHKDDVTSVAFSPDGRILASGSWDKTVILWDISAQQPLGPPLEKHENPVCSVAFNPDSTILASVSLASASSDEDETVVILWDISTQQPLMAPLSTGHSGNLCNVAFSPDGRILALASNDGSKVAKLWKIEYVDSMTFSSDNQLLALGSSDNTIRLWDVGTTIKLSKKLTKHSDSINSVAFNSDDQILASASDDKTVRLWDIKTGKSSPPLEHATPVSNVIFSPNDKILASRSDDNTVRLWDITTRTMLLKEENEENNEESLPTGSSSTTGLAFSPNGQILASTKNGTLQLSEINNICSEPCMDDKRNIIMNCIFINGKSFQGYMVPKGIGEWGIGKWGIGKWDKFTEIEKKGFKEDLVEHLVGKKDLVEYLVEKSDRLFTEKDKDWVEKWDNLSTEKDKKDWIEYLVEKKWNNLSTEKDKKDWIEYLVGKWGELTETEKGELGCGFNIQECVTVGLEQGNIDSKNPLKHISFFRLPILRYTDDKTYDQTIVLKKVDVNKDKKEEKDRFHTFKIDRTFKEQPGVSKSYGTLKPLQDLKEKLPVLPADSTKKKLLAVYMVGSDLGEFAQNDLIDLVNGYRKLSNKSEIDIVVAYGGSSNEEIKPNSTDGGKSACPLNWKGVRFTKLINENIDETNINEKIDKEIKKSRNIKEEIKKINGITTEETKKSCFLLKYLEIKEEDYYNYIEERANMGDKSTLRHFLSYLKKDALFEEHKERILIFWGHGGSYRGFGNDQVYSMDALSLPEIQEAFQEIFKERLDKRVFDLIGFDACLMGSVEVADILAPYTKYLLASEDLEPGDGWNWSDVIRFADISHDDDMTKESDANVVRFAHAIINKFTSKDSDTPGGFGKTLSVVDLRELKTVKEKFNAVASTAAIALNTPLEHYVSETEREEAKELRNAFFKAAVETSSYGRRDQSLEGRIAIDWKNFAYIVRKNINAGSVIEQINTFIRALDKYIVYSNHSGRYANGVSFGGLEQEAPQLSGAIDDFRQAFLAIKESDKEHPKEVSIPRDVRANDLFERLKSSNLRVFLDFRDNIRGIAAKFKDDVYVAAVTTVFAKKLEEKELTEELKSDCSDNSTCYQVIAELEAHPTEFEGLYFTPFWNNEWYTIEMSDEKYVEIPLAFQYRYLGTDGKWYTYYSTKIKFQRSRISEREEREGRLGRLDLIVDNDDKIRGHMVRLYQDVSIEDGGEFVLFDKNTFQIKSGDIVTFYYDVIKKKAAKEDFVEELEVKDPEKLKKPKELKVNFSEEDFPKNLVPRKLIKSSKEKFYVAMQAKDLTGKVVRTKFFEVPSDDKDGKSGENSERDWEVGMGQQDKGYKKSSDY